MRTDVHGYRNHETYLTIVTLCNDLFAHEEARSRISRMMPLTTDTFRDLVLSVDSTFWPNMAQVDWVQVAHAVMED